MHLVRVNEVRDAGAHHLHCLVLGFEQSCVFLEFELLHTLVMGHLLLGVKHFFLEVVHLLLAMVLVSARHGT